MLMEVPTVARELAVFLPFSPPADVVHNRFLEDPGSWLPDPRPSGPNTWRIMLSPGSGAVSREVAVTVDGAWKRGDAVWRPLRWRPTEQAGDAVPIHRLLPSFDGDVGLHLASCSMVLSGRYDPPGGVLAELMDSLMLHRVARNTGEHLVAQILERLVMPASAPAQPR